MRHSYVIFPLLLAACGGKTAEPRDQWTVVIGTDAPLPEFGDRLLVEVTSADGTPACAGCRRELGLPAQWPVSFGIEPMPDVATPHVRIRLYRAAATDNDGGPQGTALIDARGELPPPHGDTPVYVELAMRCFGTPSDVGSSCDPTTGTAGPERVLGPPPSRTARPGTWAPAQTRDCKGAAPDGMICIPGGAFLLGSPRYFNFDDATSPVPEHLVQLSPFAIDQDELTVGAYRQLVVAGTASAPHLRGASSATELCTWLGPDDASNDAMPVNCVTYDQAAAACAALGKRLPTEAEWEFAASNRTQETLFPWGDDDSDICKHANVGRGRALDAEPTFCLTPGAQAGPAAGGNANDVTALGVQNLGGNVDEWIADWCAPYSDPCWNTAPVLVDPRCDTPSTALGERRVVRGSDWAEIPLGARSYSRNSGLPSGASAATGFRCVISM